MVHNVSAYCVAGLGALVKWPSAMTSATCCATVPRGKTKLRNKNYNKTPNPRNEICTLLAAAIFSQSFFVVRIQSDVFLHTRYSTNSSRPCTQRIFGQVLPISHLQSLQFVQRVLFCRLCHAALFCRGTGR